MPVFKVQVCFTDQVVLMQNFYAKIGSYATVLGMTTSQVTAAQALCATFINAFNATEQSRATMIAPNGGDFAPVAFLTNTPGSFQITPANPNQPESGVIRAVYIKKNAEYGNYSANYPVTVS
jgi:hypothetical protein